MSALESEVHVAGSKVPCQAVTYLLPEFFTWVLGSLHLIQLDLCQKSRFGFVAVSIGSMFTNVCSMLRAFNQRRNCVNTSRNLLKVESLLVWTDFGTSRSGPDVCLLHNLAGPEATASATYAPAQLGGARGDRSCGAREASVTAARFNGQTVR